MTAPLVEVAAGCLLNARGEVLLAQRPAGKIAAGQWEFPGGKLEPGESAFAALCRELHEELGIEVTQARPLIRVTHAYRERTVRLDTWLVTAWRGEPHGRETQALAWARPEATAIYPILAADAPILRALQLPSHYVFTAPEQTEAAIVAGLSRLPAGALLRLRLPSLGDADYAALARRLRPRLQAAGLRLIVDRDPALAEAVGADGWHARSTELRALSQRPALPLSLASCHDADELRRAQALGFDAAVLGPLRATATHPGASGLGWEAGAALTQNANLPVYWIGGLSAEDLPAVHDAYAQGVAAIRAYWS